VTESVVTFGAGPLNSSPTAKLSTQEGLKKKKQNFKHGNVRLSEAILTQEGNAQVQNHAASRYSNLTMATVDV